MEASNIAAEDNSSNFSSSHDNSIGGVGCVFNSFYFRNEDEVNHEKSHKKPKRSHRKTLSGEFYFKKSTKLKRPLSYVSHNKKNGHEIDVAEINILNNNDSICSYMSPRIKSKGQNESGGNLEKFKVSSDPYLPVEFTDNSIKLTFHDNSYKIKFNESFHESEKVVEDASELEIISIHKNEFFTNPEKSDTMEIFENQSNGFNLIDENFNLNDLNSSKSIKFFSIKDTPPSNENLNQLFLSTDISCGIYGNKFSSSRNELMEKHDDKSTSRYDFNEGFVVTKGMDDVFDDSNHSSNKENFFPYIHDKKDTNNDNFTQEITIRLNNAPPPNILTKRSNFSCESFDNTFNTNSQNRLIKCHTRSVNYIETFIKEPQLGLWTNRRLCKPLQPVTLHQDKKDCNNVITYDQHSLNDKKKRSRQNAIETEIPLDAQDLEDLASVAKKLKISDRTFSCAGSSVLNWDNATKAANFTEQNWLPQPVKRSMSTNENSNFLPPISTDFGEPLNFNAQFYDDFNFTKTLVGDLSRPFSFPVIEENRKELSSVSAYVLSRLIRKQPVITQENNNGDSFLGADTDVNLIIVDCRYPYEYLGGHIESAVNLYTYASVKNYFIDNAQNIIFKNMNKKLVVVFHCEFSSKRGPNLARFLRNQDRNHHKTCYPKLFYPEVYILKGGYKEFYTEYSELCNPSDYVPMADKKYNSEYNFYRKESKSSSSEILKKGMIKVLPRKKRIL